MMKLTKMRITGATMILAISCCTVLGFSPLNSSINSKALVAAPTSTTSLYGGGFGGGGTSKKSGTGKKKKKNTNKETKLKPKQQWDRYSDFKREPKVQVGVRIKNDESDEWLEVGRVKSKDSQFTEAAVFRQRAIIAEHAKRLYPLQLSSKPDIEWGYLKGDNDSGEWKIVDKTCLTDAVEGLEKMVGFEGRPDPASGFYCVYDGGRLKLGEESSFS
mmetsp:Transcript_17987/g.41467  ORF Transcript_17987/g.41467 Transcript_17987/m.41467 type:complete len:217 (+) Transcript_17987:195-845(+)